MSKGCSAGGGAVYGIGFLGALVYHLQYASGLREGLWGLVKAIFWPGFMVHRLLEWLG